MVRSPRPVRFPLRPLPSSSIARLQPPSPCTRRTLADQAVDLGLGGSIARLDELPQSTQTVEQREERTAATIVKLTGDPPPLVLTGAQQAVKQAPLCLVTGEHLGEPISRFVYEWRHEDDREKHVRDLHGQLPCPHRSIHPGEYRELDRVETADSERGTDRQSHADANHRQVVVRRDHAVNTAGEPAHSEEVAAV